MVKSKLFSSAGSVALSHIYVAPGIYLGYIMAIIIIINIFYCFNSLIALIIDDEVEYMLFRFLYLCIFSYILFVIYVVCENGEII